MDVLIIIILMAVVTYLPRLIPMYFFNVGKIPAKLKLFFSFIPYAALGALILPGSINAINGKPIVSILGITCAAVIAWFNSNIIITVFLTIAAVYLMLLTGL
ncbi:MAG: AzlD domain-containing protein [Spirochaetes bacterium]|nr:AzlD domain-containing protein [Spirochaetota bacterium]